MYAVISTIDDESIQRVNALRAQILTTCQVDDNVFGLEPHVSWQGAEDYELPAVTRSLTEITNTTAPIEVSVGGIGVFSGPHPVIYLVVTRSPELNACHAKIWESLQGLGQNQNLYFSPKLWIPHISIFYIEKESAADLTCALVGLLTTPIQFTARLNTISLAFDRDGQYGISHSFPFTGVAV